MAIFRCTRHSARSHCTNRRPYTPRSLADLRRCIGRRRATAVVAVVVMVMVVVVMAVAAVAVATAAAVAVVGVAVAEDLFQLLGGQDRTNSCPLRNRLRQPPLLPCIGHQSQQQCSRCCRCPDRMLNWRLMDFH